MRQKGVAFVLKRALDVAAASAGAVIAAPILVSAAVAVRVTMGRPVLFRQARVGRDGKTFDVVKFRTMRVSKTDKVDPTNDGARLTPVGAFLRRNSIDELPQLWNVIRGDMSIVGPRPLLPQYLPRYSSFQARRHEVLPGITGWTQVNGRNALSWPEKFALDVWYVDHWSPWLDVRVIAKTVVAVVTRRGISNEKHVTMPEFMGNQGSTS